MRIAVDTRLLQSAEMPETAEFTREVFTRVAEQQPRHQFIYFVDSVLSQPYTFPNNVTVVAITPAPSNILLYKWWYDVKLTLALKKNKADIFVASYGLGSLATSVPQIFIIRELAFLKGKNYFPYNSYFFYKKFTSGFVKKAKVLVTLSDFLKQELVSLFKVNKDSIQTIGAAVSEPLKPITWEQKEQIKERYTQGCEYFIFVNSIHQTSLLTTIKAFSIFKKWQKTNMKLLVTGNCNEATKKELQKLTTYKYKDDIVLKEQISKEEKQLIIAAAYAMIFTSFYEGFATPVLEALQSGVPVITLKNSSMSEIAGAAGLYIDNTNPADIAEQMKTVFKDEQLRSRLTEAGIQRAATYDWNKTATVLWKVIEQAVCK